MEFNNNCSRVKFFPEDTYLDEVIAKDTKELEEIGGSFEAIGNRMDEIVAFAESNMSLLPHDHDAIVKINAYSSTRGTQRCPFKDCDYEGREINNWNEDVQIENSKTGKNLTINSGTAHLARAHKLLEKDNKYGISAKEFYEQFMPKK